MPPADLTQVEMTRFLVDIWLKAVEFYANGTRWYAGGEQARLIDGLAGALLDRPRDLVDRACEMEVS